MKKLARKLRKSQNDDLSLPTRDDPAPMDTQEQEELVRSFEKSQAQQSRMWRAFFASFLFCFAAFLMHSIHQQVISPWELRFHAYFMEEVDSSMIISADWLAVVACSLAIKGLLHNSKHHRRWIWCSFFTGIIVAVFWLYYMLRIAEVPLGCDLASVWTYKWHRTLSICGSSATGVIRRDKKTSWLYVCLQSQLNIILVIILLALYVL